MNELRASHPAQASRQGFQPCCEAGIGEPTLSLGEGGRLRGCLLSHSDYCVNGPPAHPLSVVIYV